MKENAKHILYLFCGLIVLFLPFETFDQISTSSLSLISETKTLNTILQKRDAYQNQERGRSVNKLLNILIVPGHDDEVWGAEYKDLKEVELNRELAKKLYQYLLDEEGINPVLASDETGYNPIFEKYFQTEKQSIEDFIKETKENFSLKMRENNIEETETSFHNPAVESVVYRLYGINRWVNVQDFDLVIHIHFNDYPGRGRNKIGKHSGFSIYTPGKNFNNYELSRKLADSIFEELKKVQSVSTLKSESEGVIEDYELIALGANESLDAGSVLIEYGYVYEDNFVDEEKREVALDYFAYSTYVGIKKLIHEIPKEKVFPEVYISKNKTTIDNLKWQYQKSLEGKYPPEGKDLKSCPIGGYFGTCSLKIK